MICPPWRMEWHQNAGFPDIDFWRLFCPVLSYVAFLTEIEMGCGLTFLEENTPADAGTKGSVPLVVVCIFGV